MGSPLEIQGVKYTIGAVLPPTFRGLDKGNESNIFLLENDSSFELRYFFTRLMPGQDPSSLARLKQNGFQDVLRAYGIPSVDARPNRLVFHSAQRGWGDMPAEKHKSIASVLLFVSLFFLLLSIISSFGLEVVRAKAMSRDFMIRVFLGAQLKQLFLPILTRSTLLTFMVVGLALVIFPPLLETELSLFNSDISLVPWSPFHHIAAIPIIGFCFLSIFLALFVPPTWLLVRILSGQFLGQTKLNESKKPRVNSQTVFLCFQVLALIALGVNLLHAALNLQMIQWSELGLSLDRCWSWGVDTRSVTLRHRDLAPQKFYRELLREVRLANAVESASLSISGAFEAPKLFSKIWDAKEPQGLDVQFLVVGPQFFSTVRQPLVIGRDFTDSDYVDAPRVAIINSTLAKRLTELVAIDQYQFRFASKDGRLFRAIGIVQDAKHNGLDDRPVPTVYIPIFQWPEFEQIQLIVRSRTSGPAPLSSEQIASLLPGLPILNTSSLREQYEMAARPRKVLFWLSAAISFVSYTILAIALHSSWAQLLAMRQKELAIRLAVGSSHFQAIYEESRIMLRSLTIAMVGGVVASFAIWSRMEYWSQFTQSDYLLAVIVSLFGTFIPVLLSILLSRLHLAKKQLRECLA